MYKSTADVEEGTKFFERYIKVEEPYLKYRQIVLDNRLPRKIDLQDEVELKENGEISYIKFEENFEGVIKSYLKHHEDSFEDVYPIWKEYRNQFKL